ncbi:hypothetical protein M885DRAFT_518962 [Pelagophyceae sp. CCMP2097]|nr:hypothetical protein M885DRAFT_518962 [Pelagophyceae sp. CCMP2097]
MRLSWGLSAVAALAALPVRALYQPAATDEAQPLYSEQSPQRSHFAAAPPPQHAIGAAGKRARRRARNRAVAHDNESALVDRARQEALAALVALTESDSSFSAAAMERWVDPGPKSESAKAHLKAFERKANAEANEVLKVANAADKAARKADAIADFKAAAAGHRSRAGGATAADADAAAAAAAAEAAAAPEPAAPPPAATALRRFGRRRDAAHAAAAAPADVGGAACSWCASGAALSFSAATAPWEAVGSPCEWCAQNRDHSWCEGFGGRFCDNGSNRCAVVSDQLDKWCGAAPAACAARCLQAAVNTPRDCATEWLRGHRADAAAHADACGSTVPRLFRRHAARQRNLTVFVHLQKTGGWSLVDYARRARVACADRIESGSRRGLYGTVQRGCEAFRPSSAADEAVLRSGSVAAQGAVLAAHSAAFELLHVELPLSLHWPAFLGRGLAGVLYVTVMREPIERAVSHFFMATRPVDMPGVFRGEPLPGATLMDFATRPLRECKVCSRAKVSNGQGFFQAGANTSVAALRGGGEFRHCCRKQWRYAADNYAVRELTGKATLLDLEWGQVSKAHLAEAIKRLQAFDAVLLTDELHRAPQVLQRRLGWAVAAAPPRLLNAGVSKAPLGASAAGANANAYAELRRRNVHDLALYARARQLWEASVNET